MGEWTQKKKLSLAGVIVLFIVVNGIALTNTFIRVAYQQIRPDLPLGNDRTKILVPEGCKSNNNCPARMYCSLDFDYAFYRTCEYNKEFGFTRAPPEFDDNESDTFTSPKFRSIRWSWALGEIIWKVMVMISAFRCSQYSWQTLVRVIKNNDKFKWNSTARALGWLCLTTTWFPVWLGIFVIGMLGLDQNGVIYDRMFWCMMLPADVFFSEFLIFEMPVAWLDLSFKTINMSKTSSKGFLAAKYVIYAWLLTVQVIYKAIGPSLTGPQKKWFTDAMKYVSMVIQILPGLVLGRLLCKDMKDTTNPNWKVANIINRTWMTAGVRIFSIAYIFSPFYIKFNWNAFNHPKFFATSFYLLWRSSDLVLHYMFLHYCLYGFRKFLQEYDTEYVSQFFGFSTVGIQSRVNSSMMMSSTGSSVADVSKASSSASVAETGKETA